MIRNFVVIFLGVVFAFFVSASGRSVYAQSAACDPDFETVLNARATMEAVREMEIAQTLILKPDSVLEYSCFHSAVAMTGGADIFSDAILHQNLFQLPPMMFSPSGPYASYLPTINGTQVTPANFNGGFRVQPGADAPGGALNAFGLDNSLNFLVLNSLLEFLYTNFGHTLAGGTFSTPSGGVCNAMDLVWKFLKCQNFNKTDFIKFNVLAYVDPRVVPSYTALNCNDPNRSTNWLANLAASYPAPGAPGGVDVLVTYLNQFKSSACSGVTPIRTGVQVYQGAPPAIVYEDAVCPAPGCYYDGTTHTCN